MISFCNSSWKCKKYMINWTRETIFKLLRHIAQGALIYFGDQWNQCYCLYERRVTEALKWVSKFWEILSPVFSTNLMEGNFFILIRACFQNNTPCGCLNKNNSCFAINELIEFSNCLFYAWHEWVLHLVSRFVCKARVIIDVCSNPPFTCIKL